MKSSLYDDVESILALLYRRRDALDKMLQRLEQQQPVGRRSDPPVRGSRTVGHRFHEVKCTPPRKARIVHVAER
jgi:hypothetical protein